ncbi:transcriptional regulator NrdR [SAR86 cluster bacterium]|jgi:transcriptional repressor NrdR|nr:transcriptional regulator NrdR [SAR86 cluster bacterium]MEC7197368.1 transcriptional regulator NrdR [Pseudomonadota bacterium]RZO89857.1 MAG: transcriptional regulator NrdR [Gammaproteobacteria bacterium]|tara:strand:- start:3659 stop:4111 length:453 start_codon:yes stop_codon:yes gene_type:complete
MKCPFCSYEESKVIDSRLVADSSQIRRRRECNKCNERWTTFELAELLMPKIVKQDKSRVPFDEIKLKEGISRSLEKRPVSEEDFETLIEQIKRDIRGFGEREVSSRVIGETVMKHLRKIDEVAFVRFASVYRSFQDPLEFSEEVKKLSND